MSWNNVSLNNVPLIRVRTAAVGIAVAVVAAGLAYGYGDNPVAAQVERMDHARPLDDRAPTITLPDFREVSRRVVPAVVTVRSEKTMRRGGGMDFFEQWFGRPRPERDGRGQEFTQRGLGSGVIVSADGYILTNNHVVEGVDRIEIVTVDHDVLKAEVVGADPQSDLAVLRVESNALKPVRLGDSDRLEVGEWVLAIGNPFSERLGHTVTAGIVSGKGRALSMADYEDFIQTDAAINPGNSGGALVNASGDLVGINTAIVSRSGGYQGIGFAIPINMARRIMDQLIDNGEVRRGYLGVRIQSLEPDLAEGLGLRDTGGALVTDVQKDTPAARGGMRADDVIVEVDGREVVDSGDLRNQIAARLPGTEVTVVVVRDGDRKKLRIRLGELPGSASAAGSRGESRSEVEHPLGLTVQELTPEVAAELGYEEHVGVLVSDVEAGAPAARAGVMRGDLVIEVARAEVRDLASFRKALAGAKDNNVVLLKVRRGEGVLYFAVRP